MFTTSSIHIKAPRERVFEVTSNLENWCPMLPHYRHINFLQRSPDLLTNTVKMACWRGLIPISWHSIHEVKPDIMEVHFTHLKAFTKGMKVIWTYAPTDGGTNVQITHDLKFRIRFLAPLCEPLIGHGFVEPVARKTLATFKAILEDETLSGPTPDSRTAPDPTA